MNATARTLLSTCCIVCLTAAASANPELFVNYEGLSGGGNHQWSVAAAPDPDFFSDTSEGFGSSLATELAFAIEGSVIAGGSVVVNSVDWPLDNPGNNPFTNTVTDGLWISDAFDQAFAAFGGNVFHSGDPVPLFSFETVGSDLTTVHYGVEASGHPTNGSIIAQTGQNFPVGLASSGLLAFASMGGTGSGDDPGMRVFTGYTGSVTSVPEPATVASICLAALVVFAVPRRNRG